MNGMQHLSGLVHQIEDAAGKCKDHEAHVINPDVMPRIRELLGDEACVGLYLHTGNALGQTPGNLEHLPYVLLGMVLAQRSFARRATPPRPAAP